MPDLDQTLLALADPARRGVIDLLREKPRRASEIAHALRMSRPAMSRHLRVLRQTGLVVQDGIDADARVRMYRLRGEPIEHLRGWLEEVEGFWTAQLASFKTRVEGSNPKPNREARAVAASRAPKSTRPASRLQKP
ncbi:MAG: metalloregulator ArsR/SmtB family transcription factor [Vicinamibacteria bacterium]